MGYPESTGVCSFVLTVLSSQSDDMLRTCTVSFVGGETPGELGSSDRENALREWCFLGSVPFFRIFDRCLFSEVRRVDRGSHMMPLVVQREHAGNLTVSVSYNSTPKKIHTALLHFVFALAHVTHEIALLEGILAYGFGDCDSAVMQCDELGTVLERSRSIVSA